MQEISNNSTSVPLSIITVCLNNYLGLVETVKSIESQTSKEFEFIVIDGGSKDGSLAYLESLGIIDVFVSEKDNGIYDAMNKGSLLAKGRYLIFMNAGDTFYSNNTVENCLSILNENKYDIIYGGQLYQFQNGYFCIAKHKKTQFLI